MGKNAGKNQNEQITPILEKIQKLPQKIYYYVYKIPHQQKGGKGVFYA
jgi:hypothetical protein